MSDDRFTVHMHEDWHEREWRFTVKDAVSGLWFDYAVEKNAARWITRDEPVSGWNVDPLALDRPAMRWATREALKHGTRAIMHRVDSEAQRVESAVRLAASAAYHAPARPD